MPQFARSYDQPAAALPHQPGAPHQRLVGLAHGVVVNLQAARQFAHTRQTLSRPEFSHANQENDLLRQLPPQRNLALATELNLHSLKRSLQYSLCHLTFVTVSDTVTPNVALSVGLRHCIAVF